MSEISILPLRKTCLSNLWQDPCWQSQKSDVCHQVCAHLRRDLSHSSLQILFQVIKVSRLMFGNSNLHLLHIFSIGLRSVVWLGHSRTLMCFFLSHFFVDLAVCFGSLSCWNTHPRPIFNALALMVHRYMAPSIVPLMRCSCPVPLAEKHPKA